MHTYGELAQWAGDPFNYSLQGDQYVAAECRIDAGTAITAEALVGRQVRMLWPQDSAWFLGSVSSYNTDDGKHEVCMLACE